nr:PR domain zinc finger protein 4-like [Penaeus vannamei]
MIFGYVSLPVFALHIYVCMKGAILLTYIILYMHNCRPVNKETTSLLTNMQSICEEHGPLTKVADTEVSTRARRSIPHILKLKEDIAHTGVYARQLLTKRLQFGPLQAEKIFAGSQQVAVEEEIKERFGIVFKITQEEGDYLLLDTQQEERSNWMIFVRPAERKSEQNLVAFQYKGDIYFATIKEIPAQCELKVWFSKDYAERMGTRILAEEGVSWQFRTRQRFRCRV